MSKMWYLLIVCTFLSKGTCGSAHLFFYTLILIWNWILCVLKVINHSWNNYSKPQAAGLLSFFAQSQACVNVIQYLLCEHWSECSQQGWVLLLSPQIPVYTHTKSIHTYTNSDYMLKHTQRGMSWTKKRKKKKEKKKFKAFCLFLCKHTSMDKPQYRQDIRQLVATVRT